jgi:hypothetical protein
MRASEEGYTVSYVVAPGAVVGKSTGAVRTASIFFKFNTEIALKFKKAVYVGEGSNVFYMVRLTPPTPFIHVCMFTLFMPGASG